MERKFTLFLVMLLGCLFTHAETDKTFSFVDSDGDEIADGSVVIASKLNPVFEAIGMHQIASEVSLKNNSTEASYCRLVTEVMEVTAAGEFQNCFAGQCQALTTTGVLTSDNFLMNSGATTDAKTHWSPTSDGECKVIFTIQKMKSATATTGENSSSITVNFTFSDPAGIAGVKDNSTRQVIGRYTLSGERLTSPQKGVNVMRYSDGTTMKYVVK